jgi:hypothetical protein
MPRSRAMAFLSQNAFERPIKSIRALTATKLGDAAARRRKPANPRLTSRPDPAAAVRRCGVCGVTTVKDFGRRRHRDFQHEVVAVQTKQRLAPLQGFGSVHSLALQVLFSGADWGGRFASASSASVLPFVFNRLARTVEPLPPVAASAGPATVRPDRRPPDCRGALRRMRPSAVSTSYLVRIAPVFEHRRRDRHFGGASARCRPTHRRCLAPPEGVASEASHRPVHP